MLKLRFWHYYTKSMAPRRRFNKKKIKNVTYKKKSFRGWDLESFCALKWHKVERVGFRPTGGSRTIYFVVKLWGNRIPFSCWNYCGLYIARRILKIKGQDENSKNSKVCEFLNFIWIAIIYFNFLSQY